MMTGQMDIYVGEIGLSSARGLSFDEAMALECGSNQENRSMLRIYSYADHCVLLGRFQRAESEVYLDEAKRRGVSVNRRPTGGGAILMGKDQIGVAYAIPARQFTSPRHGFSLFAQAIITAFDTLGITASLRGKNDIEINGRKIAGLGFYQSGDGLLFHASILNDLDPALLLALLRVPLAKLGAHGISGVLERITTLRRESDVELLDDAIRDALVISFEQTFGYVGNYDGVSEELKNRADELCQNKYSTDEWLFDGGRSNSGEFTCDFRTDIGTLHLIVANQGEVIKSAVVTGDFNFQPSELIELEEVLRWAVIQESVLASKILASERVSGVVDPSRLAKAICESYTNTSVTSEPRRIGSCYIPEELSS